MADLKTLTINDVTYDNFPFVVKVDTANGTASHSPAEIQAAAEEGRTVLVDFGGGSPGYIISRSATSVICIQSFHFGTVAYVTGYKIDADKKVTETASYTSENIPEAKTADNGKILKVVDGAPVWDSDYDLPVGGDELGGVKNGGTVYINEDGTMEAPEVEVGFFQGTDGRDGVSISVLTKTGEGTMDVQTASVYNGKDGAAGGYYTPAVTQPDDETIQFDFTPSKEGMPAVAAAQVKLPVGSGTGAEEVVISSEEPTDENAKIWINPDEEDEASGGTSINVTAEVGQTIVVKAVDENGKPTAWEAANYVSSWNDLTDKPFGDMVEVFQETAFQYDESMGVFVSPNAFLLVTGYDYVIRYNGVDYPGTAIDAVFANIPCVVVGNPAPVGGENNGLPFAIAYASGMLGAIPLDGSTSVNVGIKAPRKLHAQYVPTQAPYIYENRILSFSSYQNNDLFICDTPELPLALLEAVYQQRPIYMRVRDQNDNGQYNDAEYLGPASVSGNYQYIALGLGLADKTSEMFEIPEGTVLEGVEVTTQQMLLLMGIHINARFANYRNCCSDFCVWFIDSTSLG